MKNKKIVIPFISIAAVALITGAVFILGDSSGESFSPKTNVNEGPRKDEQKNNDTKDNKELYNNDDLTTNDSEDISEKSEKQSTLTTKKKSIPSSTNKDDKKQQKSSHKSKKATKKGTTTKSEKKEEKDNTATNEQKQEVITEQEKDENKTTTSTETKEQDVKTEDDSTKVEEVVENPTVQPEENNSTPEVPTEEVKEETKKDNEEEKTSDTTKETITKEEEQEEKELIPSLPIITNIFSSPTSITINFLRSENANSYKCSIGDNEGIIIPLLNDELQCNINNLEDGTMYDVVLTAINKTEEVSIHQNVQTEYKTPSEAKLISSNTTSNEIYANFSKSDNAKAYTCLYKDKNMKEFKNTSVTLIDDTVYCNVKDLEEATEYELIIKSINGDKESLSDIITLKTKYKTPDKPIVEKIEKTIDSIKITTNIPKNSTNISCKYGVSKTNLVNYGEVSKDGEYYVCELKNLTANTNYLIELTSTYKDKTFNSLELLELNTNDYETPSKPVLSNVIAKIDEISVVFGTVDNAKDYKIYLGKDADSLTEYTVTNTENGIAYKFKDLEPSTKYVYKLVAINGTKQTESDLYEKYTKDLIPEKPEFVDYTKTPNKINARFKTAKNAKNYICYYGTNQGNIDFMAKTNISEDYVECDLKSLTQNTNYYLKLVAINNDEQNVSDIITVKTDYETPSKPIASGFNKTPDSLTISYKKPDFATSYTCYYGTDKDHLDNQVIGKENGNEIKCELNGLNEGTDYYVKLFVTNNFQSSNESEVLLFKTDYQNPDVPTLYNITSTDNSITANYSITRNDLMYVCYYGTSKDNMTNSKEATIVNGFAQCHLNDLDENKGYLIMLSAVNKTKTSVSDIISMTTKYTTPEKPVVESKESTNDSISLTLTDIDEKYTYTCKYGSNIDAISNVAESFIQNGKLYCNLDNLLEKKNYYIKVIATNGTEVTESDIIQMSTQYKVPSKPIKISEEVTANSINAKFNLSDAATEYACYYGTDENSINKIGTTFIENNVVNCSISSLDENTSYYFKVVASNNNEVFTESDVFNVKTDFIAPEKPQLKNTTNTGNAITAIYTINSKLETMTCKYGTDSNNLDKTATAIRDNAGNVICNVTGLEEYTDYYFQLEVSNGGYKKVSDVDKITTGGIKPDASTLVSTKNYYTSLSALFSKVDNADDYQCYMGKDKNNLNMVRSPSFRNGQVACDYDKLDSNTTYYIQMKTIRKNESTLSDIYTIKTDGESATAAELKQSIVTYNSIYAEWQLKGNYTKQECFIGKSRNSITTPGAYSVHGQEGYCFFPSLESNTTYYVKMLTTNQGATAEKVVTITTKAANNPVVKSDLSTTLNGNTIIPTAYVNDKNGTYFGESMYDEDVKNLQYKIQADMVKVVQDYNNNDTVFRSVASWGVYYLDNRRVGAYYIYITVYDINDNETGAYYLTDTNERVWQYKNGF